MPETPEIVFLSGAIADAAGSVRIKQLADALATMTGRPVVLLTHSPSDHHHNSAYRGLPRGFARDLSITFGPRTRDQIKEFGE